jgi:hypothetical protein
MSESLYAAEGKTSNYVTTEVNTTGQSDAVLTIQPEDGVGLILVNRVDVGQKERGIPIYMDLRDSNDDPLPLDTEVEIAYEAPTDDSPQVVSYPLSNISTYRKKTISEQQDAENVDAVKVELKSSELRVRDIDQAFIRLNSSAQIDHSNSEIYIDADGVNEVDIE